MTTDDGQRTTDTQPSCVFVGALDDHANVISLCWYCRRVWPEIEKRVPAASFTIVGSNPVRKVRRLAEISGVTLASDVPDVRPYLDAATIAVFPIRFARGIQDQVLQALAMGKAVIATPVALEGLGVQSGVHLYSVATTDDWIAVTSRLLENPDLCTALRLAGRAYVEQNHRWDMHLQRFVEPPLLAELTWY